MKFNTPIPQPLPKECAKAAKIFLSFVDTRNQGLDGVIPRSVLEHAKGFAIFSVFKAGFLFSARAGSGIVIARLTDGTWSAPSAMGTVGMGFGGQAGAEVTDFLITLNSRSAVKSFMAAGSLTLGGNMSIAIGPLGRNGEASTTLASSGNIATMYSYSKTKGLFGGLSIEGSVIVERQDANALAYEADVSAKLLLSGAIPPPKWARELIVTLENCTGLPGGRKWIQDGGGGEGYAFGGTASPHLDSVRSKKARSVPSFPPASWGKAKDGGSYFTSDPEEPPRSRTPRPDDAAVANLAVHSFPTRFDSSLPTKPELLKPTSPSHNQFEPLDATRRSKHTYSLSMPPATCSPNPFQSSPTHSQAIPSPLSLPSQPTYTDDNLRIAPVTDPSQPHSGVARAIAMFDFRAIEPGDLSFSKGDLIVITEKSDKTDDWWTGAVHGRQGIFPANFVQLA